MTRVRTPGTWNDGSAVPGTEFEALDQGQHTAIKWGDGAVYTMTLNPLTIAGTGARVAGDGLKLDSADGPVYSGGMAMAPLKREFILEPSWAIATGETPWSWTPGGMAALQTVNDLDLVMFTLRIQQWHKQKLRRLRMRVMGGNVGHTDGNIASMTKPRFVLAVHDIMSSTLEDVIGLTSILAGPWYSDPSTTAAGYNDIHRIFKKRMRMEILVTGF